MTEHTEIQIQRIAPRSSSLGEGLMVARTLPSRGRRLIGAWCFLDHIGPVQFAAEQGLHVGAHPHTRLQTFTWMIEGELLHRDSLGSEQVIRPGQVNLMTAGHGISHTEDSVQPGQRMHAAQLWIALPDAVADCPPDFAHYPELPQWRDAQAPAVRCSLMAGQYGGHQAPTAVHSPLLGLELLHDGKNAATLTLTLDAAFEHGLMALEGGFTLAGEDFSMDELAYLAPGPRQLTLQLAPGARVLLLGGQPLNEPVSMWWNFVGPDLATIRGYRADWEAASPRFGSVPGGEDRRIPAPALP
ncbi:pirin family protein [Comamonas sp. GB3 AK4-5]|uniref:pirin family protein n=1 Tax=Comamonas sp. GB3 AK4-5 TaxID=3231487 RepID=UPI00351EE9E1